MMINKYVVRRVDGTQIDPKAKYFVLRYDIGAEDAVAAQAAMLEFARNLPSEKASLADRVEESLRRVHHEND